MKQIRTDLDLNTTMAGPHQGSKPNPSKKSSRLCVKGIPKHLTEARLKEIFSQKGNVTDVKILRTKAGASRQFAFVGFSNEADASRAKGFFHNTFIDTSRVSTEFALPVGDDRLSRPWSRYSKGSSRYANENPSTADSSHAKSRDSKFSEWSRKMKLAENSSEFQEFLSVVKPRSKSKFWANDDVTGGASVTVEQEEAKKPGGKGVFYKKIHKRFDAPNPASDLAAPAAADSDSDSDDEAFNNPMLGDDDAAGSAVAASDSSVDDDENEGVSKAQGEQSSADLLGESSEDEDEREPDGDGHNQKKSTGSEEQFESGRLFLRNLSYSVGEDDLVKRFGKFGEITECIVPTDDIGRGKGFALIQFMLPESAIKAMQELDGSVFQGRLLHVLPAKPRPSNDKDENAEANGNASNYKKKIEQKRKREGQSEHHWNSLFVRSDTVAAAAARRHGMSKGELLDAEAGNVAVRMALAETQAIAETKEFLEENGVALQVFDGT